MNTSTQNKIYWVLGVIIVILALIWVGLSASNHSSVPAATSSSTDSLTGTSTAMASSSPALFDTTAAPTMVVPKFAFAVQTASSTYSQNDVIPITLAVLNMTGDQQTLSFSDGCQGTYNIGDFSMLAHIQCQPNPTSFSIPPHGVATIPLAHYPSVYKIPPGKYTLTANVVGYGGSSAPITITQ